MSSMRGGIRIAALVLVRGPILGSSPLGTSAASPQVRWSCAGLVAALHSVRTLVYLPPSYRPGGPRLPTLYLLHGTPGTPDGLFALGVQDRLDSLIDRGVAPAMIVVAPSGGHGPTATPSGTTPSPTREPAGARSSRATSSRRSTPRTRRSTAGLARDRRHLDGRLRAINLALGHSATFGIASSWSGYFVSNTPAVDGPEGSRPGGRARRCSRSPSGARAAAPADRDVVLLGPTDRFFGENVSFNKTLSELGIPHRFRAVAGGHDASVWRAQMTTELTWIGREFQRAKA